MFHFGFDLRSNSSMQACGQNEEREHFVFFYLSSLSDGRSLCAGRHNATSAPSRRNANIRLCMRSRHCLAAYGSLNLSLWLILAGPSSTNTEHAVVIVCISHLREGTFRAVHYSMTCPCSPPQVAAEVEDALSILHPPPQNPPIDLIISRTMCICTPPFWANKRLV